MIGRLSRWGAGAARAVRQVWLTIALLTVLWTVGLLTASIIEGPTPQILRTAGVGVGSLAAGHLWSPLSAALWCSGLAGYLGTTVLLLALCAPAERRLGAKKTAVVLLCTQVVGTIAGLALIYGFRSLLAFKAKFQPAYRPLFMAYPDPAALPIIATAIGRAYLPHLTARQGSRLLRRLVRRPQPTPCNPRVTRADHNPYAWPLVQGGRARQAPAHAVDRRPRAGQAPRRLPVSSSHDPSRDR